MAYSFFIGNTFLEIKSGHKIIGYIARTDSCDGLCLVDSAVVAGSEALMNKYIAKYSPSASNSTYTIKKIKLYDIIDSINKGFPCSFDKGAFGRLEPLLTINNLINGSVNQLMTEDGFITIDSFSDASKN